MYNERSAGGESVRFGNHISFTEETSDSSFLDDIYITNVCFKAKKIINIMR